MKQNILNNRTELTKEQKNVCLKDILTMKLFSDNAKRYISPTLSAIGEVILLQALSEVVGNGK